MEIPGELLNRIRNAESIVFFTGAGISAESGIPTFRGENGIWKKLKPEELANFDAFLKNPEIVTEWYNHRRQIIHQSEPNAGHYAITEFQKRFDNVTVITQNVDNLHRRAGNKNIFELHGNIERNYCIKCKTFYNDLDDQIIPICPKCGGLIRPDVVWFGELLPEDQLTGAEKAASECDIFFCIGTSAVVYPAASLIYTAKQSGAYLIEINIENTEISSLVNYSFKEKSGIALPEILKAL